MFDFLKKSSGLLGMNARNLSFIRPGTSSKAKRLVDSKLRTKQVLRAAGLPVVDRIATIRNWKDFGEFNWESLPTSFVLKPNRGFGGEGIMVTFGRKKNGNWVLPGNREANLRDVMLRTGDILDGDFSLSNTPDKAFFEQRIRMHPAFKLYSYKGVPDIRIVVYNRVPVMAMLRLPTKESNGKANLHAGGIGVGIDIKSGRTTHAILHNDLIYYLPGTKFPLSNIQMPFWDEILRIAVDAAVACNLNYTGVDIALDKEHGPVILELNARPGLQIQLANLAPLKERLLRVKGLQIKTTKKGINVAKDLFGGDIEQDIEELSGRQIIGSTEKITLIGKNHVAVEVTAKVDTGAGLTSIDVSLAKALGYESAVQFFASFQIKEVLTREEMEALREQHTMTALKKHPDIVAIYKIFSSHGGSYRFAVPLQLTLSGIPIATHATVIERSDLQYPIIIGRRDLKKFLVDPSK